MILSCQNISKAFGTECIVTQASFHIEDHEKAAIVGINGAGKTTLLRMIVGELEPDSGVVARHSDILSSIRTSTVIRRSMRSCSASRRMYFAWSTACAKWSMR